MEFRLLRSDEIQCRINTINEKGLSLLLYKDARCDMTILDETVGRMNWQRHHSRENANCVVSIWDADKRQWIEKEDTGTESNTEAEKGLASDSFKRACTNWGIGRELYTAPFIWVPASGCGIREKNGKFACYDKFEVLEIAYTDDRKISRLVIGNSTRQTIAYPADGRKAKSEGPKQNGEVVLVCADCGKPIQPWMKNGEIYMDAQAVSDNARRDYGRSLCLTCIKALHKNENAD